MFMSYATTKLMEVLDQFCESSDKVCEYVYSESDYANSTSAANSLRAGIKRFHYGNVKVSEKNGKVYMIKKF